MGDPAEDKGSDATGGDAHNHVARAQIKLLERGDGALLVIFGPFDRLEYGLWPTGNKSLDDLWVGAEGRRAFGGVENAEPAAGAGPEIDQSATLAQLAGDQVDGASDRIQLRGDGTGDERVFAIDYRQHLAGGNLVEPGAGGIALFGE